MTPAKPVAIVMGSQSDWPTMRRAAETLRELGVEYEARIVSAHRTPDRLVAFAKGAQAARVQGHHRRRGRRGASARHDGGVHDAAGVRRARANRRRFRARTACCRSCRCRRACRSARWRSAPPGAVNAALLAAAVLALADPELAAAARGVARRAARRRAGISERRDGCMILSPGATIGILGAGQLGRMLAIAALKIGLRCHIYAPEAEAPAHDAASAKTVAAYDDEAALAAFAAGGRRRHLRIRERADGDASSSSSARKPVRPGARALALTQDRLVEKTFLRDLGLETAPFIGVEDAGALVRAVARTRPPLDPEDAPLRLRRQGPGDDPRGLERRRRCIARSAAAPMILEGFVAFEREVSVDRGAQPRGRGRRLRSLRERARAPHSRAHARARAGRRPASRPRRKRDRRARSSRRSTMSA